MTVGPGKSAAAPIRPGASENATDPNNGNVHYYNTTPSQTTTARPTTLQVITDATSPTGRALRMTILPDPNFSTNGDIYDSAEISTKLGSAPGNNIQYGHIEACIKVAGGPGTRRRLRLAGLLDARRQHLLRRLAQLRRG